MQNARIIAKALIMSLVIVLSPITACAQESAPFDGGSLPEETVYFSFNKADWEDVISWFADQTGLSWQPISKFPQGTFTLDDAKGYTPFEALDQLNYALRLHEPPYTIIRNRDQLILTEASRELPVELIPKVTPDELDQRGDFEILSCQFDLGVLNVEEIQEDLKVSISDKYLRHARALPSLNSFVARGTGADLKSVHRTIEALTSAKTRTLAIYNLKHYDPEQFLMAARGPLKIPSESYETDDGDLSISVDPSSGRLFVNGTPSAHKAFKEVVELLDVAPTAGNAGMERFYLKSYAITTDPEMARKVVETQLDGTTATIGQNEITGAIVLRGTEAQHKIAEEVINTIQGEAGSTKIVELQNASATTILEAVSSLLNISPSSGDNPNAPRLLANTSQNYIMIHGSPQQIFKISGMIAQLDQAQGRDPNRIRTNARVIEMSAEKRDELLESVQDYWPSTGRKNSLRIIMPNEKVQDKLQRQRKKIVVPEDSSTGIPFPPRRRLRRQSVSQVRTAAYQQIIEKTPAEANVASTESETLGSRYTPPVEIQSVPGSDLTIKATPFGVLIESNDLDALDDLEDIFRAQALEDGVDQGLTIFYLKFRKAASVKAALEQMFGLASGSGGSDGGGLMGGIMDNVAGEGTGDLLGGLLGGSSMSSAAGAIELSGDVQIGMYTQLNLLYVSGATASDLNHIQDAIDLFDQASAPQDPQLVGQAYSIPILHRAPQGVFDTVAELMADQVIVGGGQSAEGGNGGGNGGENGINQMAKMMRGMAGGGGGGGNNNAAANEESPKARMSLDEETGQILLVGPEFIYKDILKLVASIDTPDLSKPKSYEILPAELAAPGTLELLRQLFGPKILIEEEGSDSDSATDSQSNNGRNGQSGQAEKAKSTESSRADQIRAEMMRNIRNQAGQRGNAAGNRGGGNRGGGGGGNRGGGGGNRGGGR